MGGNAVPAKKICLKPYGKIAEKYIRSMEAAYPDITVENYIIMPNHIHLLILIDRPYSAENLCGAPRSSPPTLSAVIGVFKRLTNFECGCKLWQRSFYDHIIRSDADYQKTWEYIEYNALKEYPENKKET